MLLPSSLAYTSSHGPSLLHTSARTNFLTNDSMASIDTLCQRLGIQHPLDQSTCIGYGQKKPTCGLLAAESSRLQAVRVLNQISRDLSHGSEVSSDRLYDLASLLLCKRWHQNQAHENAERWTVKLKKIAASTYVPRNPTADPSHYSTTYPTQCPPQEAEYHPIPPQPCPPANHSSHLAPRGPQPRPDTYQPGLHSCSTQELIAEIQKRLGSVANNQLLSAIVSIADGQAQDQILVRSPRANAAAIPDTRAIDRPTRTVIDLSTIDGSSVLQAAHTTAPRQVTRTQARDIPRANTVATTTSSGLPPAARSASRPSPTGEDIRQARITALALAPRSATPETPVRPASPLRSSYVECAVCMEPYEDGDTDQWECQSCQNRAHKDCYQSWRAAPSAGSTRCMYCRATIPQ